MGLSDRFRGIFTLEKGDIMKIFILPLAVAGITAIITAIIVVMVMTPWSNTASLDFTNHQAAKNIYSKLNDTENGVKIAGRLLTPNSTLCEYRTLVNSSPHFQLIDRSDPYADGFRQEIPSFEDPLYTNISRYYANLNDATNSSKNLYTDIGESSCNNASKEANNDFNQMKNDIIYCYNQQNILKSQLYDYINPPFLGLKF